MSIIHHTNAIYIAKVTRIVGEDYMVTIDGIRQNLHSEKVQPSIPKGTLLCSKNMTDTPLEEDDKVFVKIMNKSHGDEIMYKICEITGIQFSPMRQYKLQRINADGGIKKKVKKIKVKKATIKKKLNFFDMLQYSDSDSDNE